MLDTTTLLAMTSIITVFVAALFLIVWRDGDRYAGMMTIKIGASLFAVASALIAIRKAAPEISDLCIGFGNLGSMLASSLIMNGALILAKKRPLWRWHVPVIILIWLPSLYFLFIYSSTPARAALSALWGFFMTSTTLFVLVSTPSDPESKSTIRTFAVLLSIECLFELSRGVFAPFVDPHIDYRDPSPVLTVFYLEVIFFIISYLVMMLQLVNSRLQGDLLRSEAWTTSAIHVANDAFALFDSQHRLIVSNSGCRDYFPGIAARLKERSSFEELFGLDPASFGLDPQWVGQYLGGAGDLSDFDRIAHLPDGSWLRVTGRRLHDNGLVLCWSDITAFKRAEDFLARELERQRELSALQRNFVSMASHQFRTPLAIIDLNAQLLAPLGPSSLPQEETSDRIVQIRRTVGRLVDLLETLLGAESMDAGKLQLKLEPVDIAHLIRETAARARELAPDREVNLWVRGLPETMPCDPMLLAQVFSNLLSNAIKYSSKPARINLNARVEASEIVVDVQDFGIGIPHDAQAMIFERFFRADNAADITGTGIGLTVARTIVELHGGRIALVSKVGAGSTFTVHLPLS